MWSTLLKGKLNVTIASHREFRHHLLYGLSIIDGLLSSCLVFIFSLTIICITYIVPTEMPSCNALLGLWGIISKKQINYSVNEMAKSRCGSPASHFLPPLYGRCLCVVNLQHMRSVRVSFSRYVSCHCHRRGFGKFALGGPHVRQRVVAILIFSDITSETEGVAKERNDYRSARGDRRMRLVPLNVRARQLYRRAHGGSIAVICAGHSGNDHVQNRIWLEMGICVTTPIK